MFLCFFFMFFSYSKENITLRKNQEQVVSITSYRSNKECEVSNVSVEFSYTPNIILNEDNLICTLLSSTGIELNSTLCELGSIKDVFSCNFAFKEKGIYYLKSFISSKYKYSIRASLLTEIRIGLEECITNLYEISTLNKRNYFTLTSKCEIYAKMNSSYYMLLCKKSTKENQFHCFLPSNFEVKGQDQTIRLAKRKKCGDLTEISSDISVYETYIEGDKYIKQTESNTIQHYYTITTTKEDNVTLYSLKNKDRTSIIPLNNCIQIKTTFPYKYNCTLSKSNPFEIGIYDFYYDEANYIENILEIYKDKIINFKVIKPSNTTANNESKIISFTHEDDTINSIDNKQGNLIRGFTFKSNSLKVSFEKSCEFEKIDQVTNYKIINCWIIAPESCTIDFYYRNQTEHYVLINGASLKIGNGQPNYNHHFHLNFSFLFLILYFFICF